MKRYSTNSLHIDIFYLFDLMQWYSDITCGIRVQITIQVATPLKRQPHTHQFKHIDACLNAHTVDSPLQVWFNTSSFAEVSNLTLAKQLTWSVLRHTCLTHFLEHIFETHWPKTMFEETNSTVHATLHTNSMVATHDHDLHDLSVKTHT